MAEQKMILIKLEGEEPKELETLRDKLGEKIGELVSEFLCETQPDQDVSYTVRGF